MDVLRIIAVFCTIAIHVSAQNMELVKIGCFEWNVFNAYSGMVRVAVPLFVMISGVLFLDPDKKVDIRKIYTKYILKIVITFGIWSLIYAICYYEGDMRSSIRQFFTGHYHMWFLFMIIGIYMIVPIVRKITESEKITEYFLALSVLCTFIIPQILKFFEPSLLKEIYQKIDFHLTEGYVCYFVAGYYLNKREIKKLERWNIYILGIMGTFVTIFGTILFSNSQGKMYYDLYDVFSVNVLLECIAVFVFVKYRFMNKSISERIKKTIGFVAESCLGIYMVHVLVIRLFHAGGFTTLSCNAVLSVPLVVMVVFLVSFILSSIMRYIPIIRKYIV